MSELPNTYFDNRVNEELLRTCSLNSKWSRPHVTIVNSLNFAPRLVDRRRRSQNCAASECSEWISWRTFRFRWLLRCNSLSFLGLRMCCWCFDFHACARTGLCFDLFVYNCRDVSVTLLNMSQYRIFTPVPVRCSPSWSSAIVSSTDAHAANSVQFAFDYECHERNPIERFLLRASAQLQDFCKFQSLFLSFCLCISLVGRQFDCRRIRSCDRQFSLAKFCDFFYVHLIFGLWGCRWWCLRLFDGERMCKSRGEWRVVITITVVDVYADAASRSAACRCDKRAQQENTQQCQHNITYQKTLCCDPCQHQCQHWSTL